MPTLIPDPKGWNIVVVGLWNRAIFSPAWITGRLTQQVELNFVVPINSWEAPLQVQFDELTLSVFPGRLQVKVDRCEVALLGKAAEVLTRIVSDLVHTPMSAVGINLRYQCDFPEGLLLDAFKSPDLAVISESGAIVQNTQISRTLQLEEHRMKFKLSLAEGKVTADFNFHRDISTAGDAITALSEDFCGLNDKVLHLLSTYGATV